MRGKYERKAQIREWKISSFSEMTMQYLWCVIIFRDSFPCSGCLPRFRKPNCACLCKSLEKQVIIVLRVPKILKP